MGEQEQIEQRVEQSRELADAELPDHAKGVAQGPEGPAGAAGADAPQGGVTGADPELED